jgi:sugar/nucleoside kinase (ribokinase family)
MFTFGAEPKKIYGGKLLENIVQALARIHTMDAALRIQRHIGLGMQVHDELVYGVPLDRVDEIKALTSTSSADEAAARLFRGPLPPLRRPGALLALTDGADTAYLYAASGHAWRLHVPTLAVKNAIGAGDVCTAIFLHELAVAARANGGWGSVDGETAAEAFAWGLAAACARCTPHCARWGCLPALRRWWPRRQQSELATAAANDGADQYCGEQQQPTARQ